MNIASCGSSIAMNLALGACFLLASGEVGWGGQSQPPQKDQAGAQAGSSGKASEQMGAEGSKDSGLRKCDSDSTKSETTKTIKKKKSKKPAPTKSS
jgi:hypothetical protein